MGFRSDYKALEERFRHQVDDHRVKYRLAPHREIFVPMTFFPRMPDAAGEVGTVFIGMYPSQNWLSEIEPDKRLAEANAKIASGFRNALSTEWDVVFHLAIRECLLGDSEIYYVSDVSKGATQPKDEKRTREWGRWYGLLEDEMKLVLGGQQGRTPRVIPVGGDVETFLEEKNFGYWLKKEGLGRLTRRVVHWAWAARQAEDSRRKRSRPPNDSFVSNNGEALNRLADELLEEVEAAPWWVNHVKANLERISDPWTAWWCGRLFNRYCEEFAQILEEAE